MCENPHANETAAAPDRSARYRCCRSLVHAVGRAFVHLHEHPGQKARAELPRLGHRLLPLRRQHPCFAPGFRAPQKPLQRPQHAVVDHPRLCGLHRFFVRCQRHPAVAGVHSQRDLLLLPCLLRRLRFPDLQGNHRPQTIALHSGRAHRCRHSIRFPAGGRPFRPGARPGGGCFRRVDRDADQNPAGKKRPGDHLSLFLHHGNPGHFSGLAAAAGRAVQSHGVGHGGGVDPLFSDRPAADEPGFLLLPGMGRGPSHVHRGDFHLGRGDHLFE